MGPENVHRGCSGPSLTLAVDTQPAHFGQLPGCPCGLPSAPLYFIFLIINFFFSFVEKYRFNNPEDCVPFLCHRSPAEGQIFLTLPCAGAPVPLSVGTPVVFGQRLLHRPWPSATCLGVLHGTQTPTRRYQFLVCSFLFCFGAYPSGLA